MGNREKIKLYSLDHPELKTLFSAYPASPHLAQMARLSSQVPIRSLTAGESITLPSGKEIQITEAMVHSQRKVFVTNSEPEPFVAELVDGRWKIDPTASIARQKGIED